MHYTIKWQCFVDLIYHNKNIINHNIVCLHGRLPILTFTQIRFDYDWINFYLLIRHLPESARTPVASEVRSHSVFVGFRFTVAQLVKAFDTHQEVVTKRSLEVTMSPAATASVDPLTKTEFPTGPNALRLFIPNIDIGAGAAAKRTRGAATDGGGGGPREDESARSPNSDDCRKRSNVDWRAPGALYRCFNVPFPRPEVKRGR